MFLKMNPNVGHLRVFDLVGAPGVAADLSHIDTPAKVTGHGMSLANLIILHCRYDNLVDRAQKVELTTPLIYR